MSRQDAVEMLLELWTRAEPMPCSDVVNKPGRLLTLDPLPDVTLSWMKRRSLRIGDLAAAAGVSADTIRHYERKGVLGAVDREESGYRCYPPEALDRLLVVRRAMSVGFTLDELSRIFRQRASGQPPCRSVRDLARRKLVTIDEQIASLAALRDALARTLDAWEERLEATPDNSLALLLDSLKDSEMNT